MLRFLIRRLALAVPTLFGICLITFALIHLAPGDPLAGSEDAAGGGRASVSARRTYFLDLPLFWNGRPQGVEGRAARLVEELAAAPPAREARARAALRRCGTACLPAVAEALLGPSGNLPFIAEPPKEASRAIAGPRGLRPLRDETAAISLEQRLQAVLAELRADHPQLAPHRATPREWLPAALALLEPGALGALARRLGADPQAVDRVVARGTATLPAVMPLVVDGSGAAQRAAAEAASRLAGIEGRLGSGSDAAVLATWREWWFTHRRDHVSFTGWERALGHVSETQFGRWLARLLTLRLGASLHDGRPVLEKLHEALPVTLLLSLLAMALAYLIAVPLGVHAAVRRGRPLERVITFSLFVLYSLPSFWVAMMLILLFGGVGLLDWFPIYGLYSPGLEHASGWTWLVDRLHHLVLPVACLTYGSIAIISRYQRGAMLEVIRQDYIRTARAKGLTERSVVFKHALRNALLPTITLLGLQLPFLISGSVVIERIFNVPGMGLMTFQAFLHRDYPVIMAVAVLAAGLTLLGLILADLCYALADPRIRLEGSR